MKTIIKTPIKVRFAECDYYQHVNNTNYLTYMDIGFADYLRKIWPDLKQLKVLFHKVHASVDYKNSATFDDDLIVNTSISEIGKTSITFKYCINKDDGSIVAEAKKIYVIMDAKTGKKCEVPEELKEMK